MTVDILKYMRPFLKVKALHAAFECGLIKAIGAGAGGAPLRGLPKRLGLTERGAELLLRVLASFGVVKSRGGRILPGAGFKKDMADHAVLIKELAAYMDLAYADMQHFSPLLKTGIPGGKVRDFFEYSGGQKASARIGGLLSASTENCAEIIGKKYNFGRYSYILDVGGNDGEFLAGLCRLYPGIKGGVFDLQGPCAIGLRKHRALIKSRRLEFFPGDFFSGNLPKKADLIVFKSVLNDWADKKISGLLSRAYDVLPAGGKMLIIERLDKGARRTADDCLFDLAFMQLIAPAQDFRSQSQYRKLLRNAGFSQIRLKGRYSAGFCIIECVKPVRKTA